MNVVSEKSITKILNIVREKKIKVDVLINNACLDPKVNKRSKKINTTLENFKLSQWNKEIEVGLTGSFLCSKIFGEYMSQNNKGVIINISSDLSVISPDQRLYSKNNPKPISYSVIKSGLVGLTKYLSTYWSNKNIRCNCLSPGGIIDKQNKKFIKKINKLIPMSRMANPDEYHSIIQFLCSDASSYLNGQNIVMDGGRSIW
jgi:NAD(P)-dependent dehydrogenase (short-subunit alcohol dehydrogenase family)